MAKTKTPKAKANSKRAPKKLVVKIPKETDYLDMMEEEDSQHDQKITSYLFNAKQAAKSEICVHFGESLPNKRGQTPLALVFATNLNGDKELIPRDKLFQMLEGLMVLNIKVLIIDTQQPADLNNLGELMNYQGEKLIWYNPRQDNSGQAREEKEIDRLLLAADLAVLFETEHDLVSLLKHYGVVMVANKKTQQLEDYHPNNESGNAFLFDKNDLWSVFASIVRSLESFKFPHDWKHIVRNMRK